MSHTVEDFAMIRTKLEKTIMEAFAFPFYTNENCQPDGNTHEIPDATLWSDGKFCVFHHTRIFPGLTFRGLKASAGDLNILTPEVEIEIEIPTIAGYFYIIRGNPGEKPEISRGSFKLNYGIVIAKGILCFSTSPDTLFIPNMAVDFEESKDFRMISYDDDGKKIGSLDDSIMRSLMWPCVRPIIYWILRDKFDKMGDRVNWHDIVPDLEFLLYKRTLHSRTTSILNEIIRRMQEKLKEILTNGKIKMPDIETMIADRNDENIWGTFSATSGWLGNIAEIRVNECPHVHMRSENEFEFIGTIRFVDLKHCYDKYSMKSEFHHDEGKIESILGGNEASVKITITRMNGESVKEGRIEFINTNDVHDEITGLDYFEWVEEHAMACMSGDLRAKGIPALNKTLDDCLNQVLQEFDAFTYWDSTIIDTSLNENDIGQD